VSEFRVPASEQTRPGSVLGPEQRAAAWERLGSEQFDVVVIGGVVVAPIASELILPIATAVQNRLTVNHLANTLSVYPSLSGSITEAARRLMAHDDLD
jgi:hypothetical protein